MEADKLRGQSRSVKTDFKTASVSLHTDKPKGVDF